MGEAVCSQQKDCRHHFFFIIIMIPIIGTQIMENSNKVVSRP